MLSNSRLTLLAEAHPTEVSSLQLTLKRSGKKLTVPPCEGPIRKWVPSQMHGSAWRAWVPLQRPCPLLLSLWGFCFTVLSLFALLCLPLTVIGKAQYSASSSKAVTSLTSTWNVPVAPISAGGQLLYYVSAADMFLLLLLAFLLELLCPFLGCHCGLYLFKFGNCIAVHLTPSV